MATPPGFPYLGGSAGRGPEFSPTPLNASVGAGATSFTLWGMAARTDEVWKKSALAATFLEGVRGAIPLAAEQLDIMVRLIAAGSKPVNRFLDLGCGDGALAAALIERFPDAEGVLADFSEPMLEAARKRFSGHAGPLYFVGADYGVPAWTELVAPWAPFDAIVSGFSIHHQPDTRKREVYAEIFGLLRPGGMFLNLEHVSSPAGWIVTAYDDLFIDHLWRFHSGKTRAEAMDQYYQRKDQGANILAPLELQCGWLREIGFIDVDCFFKILELAVFGGRRP